jgi:hypothetical protein
LVLENLLSGLVGSLVGGGLAWWGSKSSTDRMLKTRSAELREERADKAVEQMREQGPANEGPPGRDPRKHGLTPVGLGTWGKTKVHLPFVRDMWASSKAAIGDLPDEVLDSARKAYALAAQ